MSRASTSQILRVVALVLFVLAVGAFIVSRRIGASEADVVAGAERDVMRSRLDQEPPE